MQSINSHRYHLLLHLIVNGIGLVGASVAITRYFISPYVALINQSLPYTGWAMSSLATDKAPLVSGYLVGIVTLYVYMFVAVLVHARYQAGISSLTKGIMQSPVFLVSLIVANALIFILFLVFKSGFLLLGSFMVWLVLLLFPVKVYQIINLIIRSYISVVRNVSVLYYGLLFLASVFIILAISPFLKLTNLQVSNDYLWVPERTKLENGVVNNNEYTISNGTLGLYKDNLLQSSNLSSNSQLHFITVVPLQGLKGLLASNNYQYDYVSSVRALFVKKDRLTDNEFESLCALTNFEICRAVMSSFSSAHRYHPIDGAEEEFVQKNKYELKQQILAGHYFHHQYAMLGPVNELSLDKGSGSITYLYGVGNTQLLSFIMNKLWPSLTFENYTFTLYSFYLLYFTLYVVCCAVIFRDVRYVLMAFAFAVGFLLMIGFESIRVAPGFNPLRHFLDLTLIMLFYAYLSVKRLNGVYLALSVTVCILAVYASKEFGSMMFAALIGASVLHIVFCARRYPYLLVVAAGLVAFYLTQSKSHAIIAPSPMSLYSLLGVSVAPSSLSIIQILLSLVFACYLALLFLYTKKGIFYQPIYLCLFIFIYCQCLWAYFAWYTEIGHLFATSSIWIMLFVLMSRELLLLYQNIEFRNDVISVGVGFSVIALVLGFTKYSISQQAYQRIFKQHVVYQWNFPRAHFKSTMDPAVFDEAINLIRKYSKGNAIYIISKYDNLLPFLAYKYSAMPFLELSTSLVTDHEVSLAADEILNKKPRYIFVDSDIHSRNIGDILEPSSQFRVNEDKDFLSVGRVRVLSESKRVFHKISSQYRLIVSGYLVSVYEHI